MFRRLHKDETKRQPNIKITRETDTIKMNGETSSFYSLWFTIYDFIESYTINFLHVFVSSRDERNASNYHGINFHFKFLKEYLFPILKYKQVL